MNIWHTTITPSGRLIATCDKLDLSVEGLGSIDELYATIEETMRLFNNEMHEDGVAFDASWSLTISNPIPKTL